MKKTVVSLALLLAGLWGIAQNPETDRQIGARLVQQNAAAIGLKNNDLNNSVVNESYVIPGSTVRMVYLQQTYQGIPVYNRLHVLAFKNDALASVAGDRVASPEVMSRNASATPALSAAAGVQAAMAVLNIRSAANIAASEQKGNDGKFRYGLPNLSGCLKMKPAG
jgi:hypothetical protein